VYSDKELKPEPDVWGRGGIAILRALRLISAESERERKKERKKSGWV
jgi:hypothetical protein